MPDGPTNPPSLAPCDVLRDGKFLGVQKVPVAGVEEPSGKLVESLDLVLDEGKSPLQNFFFGDVSGGVQSMSPCVDAVQCPIPPALADAPVLGDDVWREVPATNPEPKGRSVGGGEVTAPRRAEVRSQKRK